jgi:CYTH domain-containing protein
MNKEIERRFLLKKLPFPTKSFPLSEIQNINQYYYLVDNVWNRIRKIESSISGNKYLHTIKSYKDGITYETEKYFSPDEFRNLMLEINSGKFESKHLDKTRYIYTTSQIGDFTETDFGENISGKTNLRNIKWEIDVFNFHLVIAEAEIPDFSFNLEIPDFIEKQLIYEITSIKEFSNRSLAEPLLFSKL